MKVKKGKWIVIIFLTILIGAISLIFYQIFYQREKEKVKKEILKRIFILKTLEEIGSDSRAETLYQEEKIPWIRLP